MKSIEINGKKYMLRIPTMEEWDNLCNITKGEDSIMHWENMCSIVTDDKRTSDDMYCSFRGYSSASDFYSGTVDNDYNSVGWRPVLELMDEGSIQPIEKSRLTIGNDILSIPDTPTWDGDIADYRWYGKDDKLNLVQVSGLEGINWITLSEKVMIADCNLLTWISYKDLNKLLGDTSN